MSSKFNTKEKILIGYRYISWLLTSIFYLTENDIGTTFKYKLIVISSLLLVSIIINDLYMDSNKTKTRVIIVETIGITILLIPTGGLDSAFIWYALNPVLVSAMLKPFYSWITLGFYLIAASIISTQIFNPESLTLFEIIKSKSEVVLVFVLITIAIRSLFKLNQFLDHQAQTLKEQQEQLISINDKLKQSNESAKKSMEHIMSLYHIIEVFSGRKDNTDVTKQLVKYAKDILGRETSFLWMTSTEEEECFLITHNMDSVNKEKLNTLFNSNGGLFTSLDPINIEWLNTNYMISPVKSTSRLYGYLGVEMIREDHKDFPCNPELLRFMADLIAVDRLPCSITSSAILHR